MNEKPDRLKLLKNRYLSQITETEKLLSSLKVKVRLIDELESDAENLSTVPNGSLKYSNGKLRLIDAALDVVKTVGIEGIQAPKVAKYLRDNGFEAKGKNFIISVGTSLKRLEARGSIVSERKEGSRLYMPKS